MASPTRNSAPLIICACLLALGATACHRRETPKAPNVDSLREALQRAASATLPTPSLVNQHFTIAAKPGEQAQKSEEIAKIARELNGTVLASPSNSDAGAARTGILVSLPANRVSEFELRALGKDSQNAAAKGADNGSPVLVEVAFEPSASAPADSNPGAPLGQP